jgi:hypothetical protein
MEKLPLDDVEKRIRFNRLRQVRVQERVRSMVSSSAVPEGDQTPPGELREVSQVHANNDAGQGTIDSTFQRIVSCSGRQARSSSETLTRAANANCQEHACVLLSRCYPGTVWERLRACKIESSNCRTP